MRKGRRRWAVFISGRGSNLSAVLECRDSVDLAVVVSSAPDAAGLLKARRAGVPTLVLPKKIDWTALSAELSRRGVTHIFLLGFMRIVPASFVTRWERRILNLHPSLLPSYPGLDSIGRAYGEGAPLGATVHEVIAAVDEGPIICQRRSLKSERIGEYSLESAEFLVHLDEQRLVKEAICRWNP